MAHDVLNECAVSTNILPGMRWESRRMVIKNDSDLRKWLSVVASNSEDLLAQGCTRSLDSLEDGAGTLHYGGCPQGCYLLIVLLLEVFSLHFRWCICYAD